MQPITKLGAVKGRAADATVLGSTCFLDAPAPICGGGPGPATQHYQSRAGAAGRGHGAALLSAGGQAICSRDGAEPHR